MMCGTGLPRPDPPLHHVSPGAAGRITPLCYDYDNPPDLNHWTRWEVTSNRNLVTCPTCITILKGPHDDPQP